MKVSSIMTKNVETVQAGDTLFTAAKKMADLNVGSLPVFEGHVLVGLITDRDLVTKGIARRFDPNFARVYDAMTWVAESCPEDMDVESAARIMEKKRIQRLVVVNQKGAIVGMLSISDLALRGNKKDLVDDVMEATARRHQFIPKNRLLEEDEGDFTDYSRWEEDV